MGYGRFDKVIQWVQQREQKAIFKKMKYVKKM